MGTMAHTRQQLLDAARYREEWTLYERSPAGRKRPRFDAALDAWREVLEGKLPLVVTAPRENDIRRALGAGRRVQAAGGGGGRAPRLRARRRCSSSARCPLLVSVNFDPPRPVPGGGGDEDREKRDIDEATRNPAALHKAGVPFALVSGHAPGFLDGVRKAIEAGLPREAALRALTLDAARALGVADRIGSLERGKLANVVLWSGDPLDRKAQVKLVFVDGQLHEPAAPPRTPPLRRRRGRAARRPPRGADRRDDATGRRTPGDRHAPNRGGAAMRDPRRHHRRRPPAPDCRRAGWPCCSPWPGSVARRAGRRAGAERPRRAAHGRRAAAAEAQNAARPGARQRVQAAAPAGRARAAPRHRPPAPDASRPPAAGAALDRAAAADAAGRQAASPSSTPRC